MAVAKPQLGVSTRERLARTALRLFAERGYNGVSNREIVEACGLTKGAIYWYFQSKEHLFQTVLAESFADWEQRVEESIGSATRWNEKLAAAFRLFVEVLNNNDDPHRDLLLLMAHQLPHGPGQDAMGHESQLRFGRWIADLLSDYDAFPGSRDVTLLVLTTGLGVLVQAAAGHSDLARPVLSALLRTLGGGPLYPDEEPQHTLGDRQ
jgi:AcrR family transcriptional regulator